MAYQVKVTGQYIARNPTAPEEKVLRNYVMDVVVPRAENVLSVIKNKLLDAKLTQMYPDYVKYRTHHILTITPLDDASRATMGEVPPEYMDRLSLLDLIKRQKLDIDARYYPDLFKLREAVKFALEDPVGYAKHFDAKKADILLELQLAKLNPELQHENVDQNTPEPPAPKSTIAGPTGAAGKAIKDPEKRAKVTEDRVASLAAVQDEEAIDALFGGPKAETIPSAPVAPGIDDL